MLEAEAGIDQFLLTYGTYIPVLCDGVLLIVGRGERFYIGYSHRGIDLIKADHLDWCQAIDGQSSLNEIFSNCELTPSIARTLIFLLDQNILELASIEIRDGHTRGVMIQSEKNFLERAHSEIPEFRRMIAKDGRFISVDSSIKEIRNRSTYRVFVIGENRLAMNIYSLLQASGYSDALLIERESSRIKRARAGRVVAGDICGLYIRESDLSLPRSRVIEQVHQSSALNRIVVKDEEKKDRMPSLVISTQTPPPDSVQRWMSEGTTHLVISHPSDSQIEIGPLVIPGESPCIQCIYYSRDESDPRFRAFELARMTDPPQEISSGSVAYIAGLITILVKRFLITGQSELLGASWIIDLINPLNDPHVGSMLAHGRRLWSPHPICGCIH